MILFINACDRKGSRTKRLADQLLEVLGTDIEEIKLYEQDFPKADAAFIAERDKLISEGRYEESVFRLARQFSAADEIVIAAPYWDLSFPAVLKQYLEQINVPGITFQYGGDGVPYGLCKADSLYYITTAGGDFCPDDYGFGYVKALAENFFGIRDVKLIKATGLDIDGADIERIMHEAEDSIVPGKGKQYVAQ